MWQALFGGGSGGGGGGGGRQAPAPRVLSLSELERLHGQLARTTMVTEANRDAVVEVLRAIAEVMIWGDQNEPEVFDFFLEAQTLSHCVRLLGASTSRQTSVAVQMLQTMSIMIQNIRRDTSVYYLFSNNHINRLIAYDFDFANEELLAFYISFLKTVSLRLNEGTVQFFFQGHTDPPSFPLYTLATRFVDHPESMVRIAVRTVTLNVYAVPDEATRAFVVEDAKNYFPAVIGAMLRRCLAHDAPGVGHGALETANAEACDMLSYVSDVLALEAPGLTGAVLQHFDQGLVEPLLLGSLLVGPDARAGEHDDVSLQKGTALHLIGRVMEIVTHAALVNGLVCRLLAPGGQCQPVEESAESGAGGEGAAGVAPPTGGAAEPPQHGGGADGRNQLRSALLEALRCGDGRSALAALQCLAAIVRSETPSTAILERVGLLPASRVKKQRLLESLVRDDDADGAGGQDSGGSDGGSQACADTGAQASPQQLEVLAAILARLEGDMRVNDAALVERRRQLACWLLLQLAPQPAACQGAADGVNDSAMALESTALERLSLFAGGVWCDMLPQLLDEEWAALRKAVCGGRPPRQAMEFVGSAVAPSVRTSSSRDGSKSSARSAHDLFTAAGAFMAARIASLALRGMPLPDALVSEAEAGSAALDAAAAFERLGSEMDDLSGVHACVGNVPVSEGAVIRLEGADALPCRVAFERGREHAVFLVLTTNRSVSTSVSDSQGSASSGTGRGGPMSGRGVGALLLVERSVDAEDMGVVRAVAHLAGTRAERDENHPCWLHICVRSPLPPRASAVSALTSSKRAVRHVTDGKWTLAFRDEHSCAAAQAFAAFATAQLRETCRAALAVRVGTAGGADPPPPNEDTAASMETK